MRLLIKLPENVSKNTSIEKNLRATLFNLLIGQLPFFMRLPTAASIITCQSWTCIKIHWTKLSLSSLKYQWLLSGCCLSVFGGHANHGNMLLQFIRYLIAEQSRQGKRHESYSELKKKRRIWMDTCWKGLGTYLLSTDVIMWRCRCLHCSWVGQRTNTNAKNVIIGSYWD